MTELPDDLTVTPWDDPNRVENAYDGIERRVLSFTDDLMLVHYTVQADAVFPEHTHEETHQAVFVLEGALDLFGDHETRLRAGDSFVVGPGTAHGIRGVAEVTRVIDAFTPPIEAYAGD